MIRNVLKRAGGERSRKAKSPAQTGTGAQRQYTEGGSGKWIPFASFCTTGQFMKLGKGYVQHCGPTAAVNLIRSLEKYTDQSAGRSAGHNADRNVVQHAGRDADRNPGEYTGRFAGRNKRSSRKKRRGGSRQSFSDVCGDWTTDTYLLEHKNPWAFRRNLQSAYRYLSPQMPAGVGRYFIQDKDPLPCPDHP